VDLSFKFISLRRVCRKREEKEFVYYTIQYRAWNLAIVTVTV